MLYSVAYGKPNSEAAIDITQFALGRKNTPILRELVASVFENSSSIYTARGPSACEYEEIGYSATSNYEVDGMAVLHVNAIAVEPRYRGRGVGRAMLTAAMCDSMPDFISLRTQSVGIYSLVSDYVDQFYPTLDDTPQEVTDDIKAIGEFIAGEYGEVFPFDRRLASPVHVYGKVPTDHKNSEFYTKCDIENGDIVAVVGKVKIDPC